VHGLLGQQAQDGGPHVAAAGTGTAAAGRAPEGPTEAGTERSAERPARAASARTAPGTAGHGQPARPPARVAAVVLVVVVIVVVAALAAATALAVVDAGAAAEPGSEGMGVGVHGVHAGSFRGRHHDDGCRLVTIYRDASNGNPPSARSRVLTQSG